MIFFVRRVHDALLAGRTHEVLLVGWTIHLLLSPWSYHLLFFLLHSLLVFVIIIHKKIIRGKASSLLFKTGLWP